MNKAILVGNLTRDPEVYSDGKVCKFDIAVTEFYNEKKLTNYFTITVFGKLGENCVKYLDKGKKVGVVGKLNNREIERRDGTKVVVTEIIASEVDFLSPPVKKEEPKPKLTMEEIDDTDMPF